MNEFDIQLSARWVRSAESETIEGLSELAREAKQALYSTPYERYTQFHVGWIGDNERGRITTETLDRPFFQEATSSEQRRILEALVGEHSWVYTTQQSTDGLWTDTVPSRSAPLNLLSRLVLSGAIGDSIFEEEPKLVAASERYASSYFERAILVGGAALVAFGEDIRGYSRGGDYTAPHASSQLQYQTHTGGSFHGDFQTSRNVRPVGPITTTIHPDATHHFMPAIYEEQAAAYHSTEPMILSSLLYHLVVNVGVDRTELASRLLGKLENMPVPAGGPFADFGSDEGERDAYFLNRKLAVSDQPVFGRHKSMVVYPSGDRLDRLNIDLSPQGVAFVNTDAEKEVSRLEIPNEEIESYIIALTSGGGGRTSAQAMMRIIEELRAA